ncbi:MAG TPA: type II secretion system F family protein, partial [Armatimonadota bacterium]|nr:type II secretion system F family protein [Armatimonadota bacterium]
LNIASHYTGSDRLIMVAREVAAALADGRKLHQALARHPDLFDPFYIEMARQGETDGALGEALLAVADYLDHRHEEHADCTQLTSRAAPRTPAVALMALGIAAAGSGCLWAAAAGGVLPGDWVGPLAALWSGAVLTVAGMRLARPEAGAAVHPRPEAPARPAERRAAEAEGIVRSALMEQQEAEEAASLSGRFRPFEAGEDAGGNGTGPHAEPSPEREPPRFSF